MCAASPVNPRRLTDIARSYAHRPRVHGGDIDDELAGSAACRGIHTPFTHVVSGPGAGDAHDERSAVADDVDAGVDDEDGAPGRPGREDEEVEAPASSVDEGEAPAGARATHTPCSHTSDGPG
jgi:hypothetical protein